MVPRAGACVSRALDINVDIEKVVATEFSYDIRQHTVIKLDGVTIAENALVVRVPFDLVK